MKGNNQADQPIRWKELLPIFFVVGLVPLLFRMTKHAYTLSEQTLYPESGFNDLYSLVKAQTLLALTAVTLIVFGYHLATKQIHFEKNISLIKNAEQQSDPALATEKDERITKIGRILRASRLDELPQLINVFRGEMSMVGPRPERSFFIEKYSEEIPAFRYRTRVKAGVTGLGQVLGKYTTTPKEANCATIFWC